MQNTKTYSLILMICGLVGIFTSFMLTLDKIELLKNPAVQLPCNVNPIISCGPVILTPQASAFGVPNPMLGLIGFSIVFTIGLVLISGAKIENLKFWAIFNIGVTAAILFIHWLIFQSIYQIGALCIYCMITWTVTWPVFLYSIKNYFNNSFLNRNHVAILIGWYLIIILLILSHFRNFFFG